MQKTTLLPKVSATRNTLLFFLLLLLCNSNCASWADATSQIFENINGAFSLIVLVNPSDTYITIRDVTLIGSTSALTIHSAGEGNGEYQDIHYTNLTVVIENCNVGGDFIFFGMEGGGNVRSRKTKFLSTSIQILDSRFGNRFYFARSHGGSNEIIFDERTTVLVANNYIEKWGYFARAARQQFLSATLQMTMTGKSAIQLVNNTWDSLYIGTGLDKGKNTLLLADGSSFLVSKNTMNSYFYLARSKSEGENTLQIVNGAQVLVYDNQIGLSIYFGYAWGPSSNEVFLEKDLPATVESPSVGLGEPTLAPKTNPSVPVQVTFAGNSIGGSIYFGLVRLSSTIGDTDQASRNKMTFAKQTVAQVRNNDLGKSLLIGSAADGGENLMTFSNDTTLAMSENRIKGDITVGKSQGRTNYLGILLSTIAFQSGSTLGISANTITGEESDDGFGVTIGDSETGITKISFANHSKLDISGNGFSDSPFIIGGASALADSHIGHVTIDFSDYSSLRVIENKFSSSLFGTSYADTGAVNINLNGPGTIAFNNNEETAGYFHCFDEPTTGSTSSLDNKGYCQITVNDCWKFSMIPLTPWQPFALPPGFNPLQSNDCSVPPLPPIPPIYSTLPPITPIPPPTTVSSVPIETTTTIGEASTSPLTTTPIPTQSTTFVPSGQASLATEVSEASSQLVLSPSSSSDTTLSTVYSSRVYSAGTETTILSSSSSSAVHEVPTASAITGTSSHGGAKDDNDDTSNNSNNNNDDTTNDAVGNNQLAAGNSAAVGEDSSSSMTGLVIGLIIAVVLVGLIVATLIALYVRRQSNSRKGEAATPHGIDFDDIELKEEKPPSGSIPDRYREFPDSLQQGGGEMDADNVHSRDEIGIVDGSGMSTLGPGEIRKIRQREERDALRQVRMEFQGGVAKGPGTSRVGEVSSLTNSPSSRQIDSAPQQGEGQPEIAEGSTLGPQALRQLQEQQNRHESIDGPDQASSNSSPRANARELSSVQGEGGQEEGGATTLGPGAIRQFQETQQQQQQQEPALVGADVEESFSQVEEAPDAEPSTLRSEQIRRFRMRY